MKNKLRYVIIFIFFLPLFCSADHIVGGSIEYEQLGGSTYRITLKLHRNCNSGLSFPNPIAIKVTKSNGTLFKTLSISRTSSTIIPPKIDTCVVNPGICLEEIIYSQVVTGLPPSTGGYHLYCILCCRNASLLNIQTPGSAAATFYTHIPDNNVVTTNSSPHWNQPLQSFLCQGNSLSIDQSASDVDGDSLYYQFYTPYDTGAVTFTGGVFNTAALKWVTGYSATNPLVPNVPNSLKISSTGIITGSPPPTIGNFVIGVRCQEWRNGIKLGEILRDIQLTVVSCPPKILANYNYNGTCTGTKISFTTLTTGASSYYWDFGNTATTADTSLTKNPTYTYPSLGKYTVMLIINKGTACADTSIKVIQITSLKAAFTSNAPA
jgi:PKD repeat protein